MRQNLLEDELACASHAVDISLVRDLMSAVATWADSGSDTEDEEEAAMDLGSPTPSAGPLYRGVCSCLLLICRTALQWGSACGRGYSTSRLGIAGRRASRRTNA